MCNYIRIKGPELIFKILNRDESCPKSLICQSPGSLVLSRGHRVLVTGAPEVSELINICIVYIKTVVKIIHRNQTMLQGLFLLYMSICYDACFILESCVIFFKIANCKKIRKRQLD